jgi:hypothetical protein
VLGLKRKLAAFLHLFGLSCLGGAVFLELLVLSDIIRRGYFLGVEPNLAVAFFELALAACAAAYYGFLCLRTLKAQAETLSGGCESGS